MILWASESEILDPGRGFNEEVDIPMHTGIRGNALLQFSISALKELRYSDLLAQWSNFSTHSVCLMRRVAHGFVVFPCSCQLASGMKSAMHGYNYTVRYPTTAEVSRFSLRKDGELFMFMTVVG
jgi:hypothetical protein